MIHMRALNVAARALRCPGLLGASTCVARMAPPSAVARVLLAMFCALCTWVPSAEAWLQISSVIIVNDETFEDDEDGGVYIIGRTTARSDSGWVVATATVIDPNGAPVADDGQYAASFAVAEAVFVLQMNGVEGEYKNLGQGQDANDYVGCQYSPPLTASLTVTYYKDPEKWFNGCWYQNTACLPGTTPSCVGGVGLNISQWFSCTPFVRVDYAKVTFNNYHSCLTGFAFSVSGPGNCS